MKKESVRVSTSVKSQYPDAKGRGRSNLYSKA